MISAFIERVPTRLVADTSDEFERVIEKLLSGPEDYPVGSVEDPHVIADLYPGDVDGAEDEDEQQLPIGWLHVSVQPQDSVGAINYIRTDGTTIESWEASGSEHSRGCCTRPTAAAGSTPTPLSRWTPSHERSANSRKAAQGQHA
ncbi:hypothetical protein SAMN04487819_102109 [Actinopolyspora alba]|uniref:Uncharacterized protein n=1 Tax=Actinopolyspora alba TaxID=673379 RepID=A0A1I1UDP4_9ACTN|nr:hypothetical protein [Actinopolyspora alba]SFD68867.1 hypothetical protein SAMN04487819_102109 [Actinopolyspora alba]